MVFVDLTKAFDTVSRLGVWKILHKISCPPKVLNIIKSFHDDMVACVIDNGELSQPFVVSNGTK